MKVFVDTNVILDILIEERRRSFPDSRNAVATAIKDNSNCYISASTVTDIYYILRKAMRSSENATDAVKRLLRIVSIADVNAQDIEHALRTDMPDFEDGVVDAVAYRHGCSYILTRNTCDYTDSRVPAITPTEFLEL